MGLGNPAPPDLSEHPSERGQPPTETREADNPPPQSGDGGGPRSRSALGPRYRVPVCVAVERPGRTGGCSDRAGAWPQRGADRESTRADAIRGVERAGRLRRERCCLAAGRRRLHPPNVVPDRVFPCDALHHPRRGCDGLTPGHRPRMGRDRGRHLDLPHHAGASALATMLRRRAAHDPCRAGRKHGRVDCERPPRVGRLGGSTSAAWMLTHASRPDGTPERRRARLLAAATAFLAVGRP